MKKNLRYFMTLLLMMVASVGWADTVTFTAGTDVSEGTSITKDGITISFSDGVFNRTDNYRCYSGATMIITSASGNMTQIDFTATSSNPMTKFSGDPDVGSWSDDTKVRWTGNASTINFGKTSGQARITKIVVTYEGSGSTAPSINAQNVKLPYDATEGEITYTIDKLVEGVNLKASCTDEWISEIIVDDTNNKVTFTTTPNEGATDRTATITLTYGTVTKDVTVTQAHQVKDFATLPFSWEGGASADLLALDGVTADGLGSDYAAGNAPYLVKFDGTGDYIKVKTNERPGKVTIGVKMLGGNTSSSIKVQQSADGETFTDVQILTISGNQNDVLNLSTTKEFAENSRYVRLSFTKGSNVGVGPISIAKYEAIVLEYYNLAIENSENVTITANYNEEVLTNNENADVEEGTEITVAVEPAEGYVFESLTIAGSGEGQTVTPIESSTEGVWTFTMPAYDVTISATVTEYVAPVTATYELATSITPGKHYVIASGKEDGSVQVMGEQKSNNRGAVEAKITDGVLEVSEAYDFLIEGSSTDGYTIFDADVPGYLYAASKSSNHLKTQTENNVNSIWTITLDASSGAASIKAEGSANRNVMQYNSGSSIFACYADASQSPVYLFEKVESPVEITISSAGQATFSSTKTYAIPEGLTAYVVTAYSKTDNNVTLTPLTSVIPANTGVVVKGNAGTYELTESSESENIATNYLKANVTPYNLPAEEVIDGENYYNYTLAADGFKHSSGEGILKAGKAYLQIPYNVPATDAKLSLVFDGEGTGINNVNANDNANNKIFNLSGQRVGASFKGLVIKNGKKYINK